MVQVSKGTGLGLSTVHRIVRESRGQIIVETVRNKGTTFEIFLPRESP
jgi:two-component system cell cycle sensor histidine kinase/response regulator CckA